VPPRCSLTRKCQPRNRRGWILTALVPPRCPRVHSAVRADASFVVPMRPRNAPTRLMKGLGYGKGYRYAHDEPDAIAAGEKYFPDDMEPTR
jgi:hypothetical protein